MRMGPLAGTGRAIRCERRLGVRGIGSATPYRQHAAAPRPELGSGGPGLAPAPGAARYGSTRVGRRMAEAGHPVSASQIWRVLRKI